MARTKLGLPPSRLFVTSRYGVVMRANWRDRTFQYCYYGTYGDALVDVIRSMKRPFVFLDIGANQGLYSLIAAGETHCVKGVAFEPVGATFALLEANIAANAATAKVAAIQAALSDHPGSAQIVTDPAHSGTASLRNSGGEGDSAGETIRLIDHSGLDPLVPAGMPIVVKIDVEGHEETVIRELMKSIHLSAITHLFYEVDRRWTNQSALAAMLQARGFTEFRRFGVGRHYDVLASRDPVQAPAC